MHLGTVFVSEALLPYVLRSMRTQAVQLPGHVRSQVQHLFSVSFF